VTESATPVQYAVSDGVATITLNRPEAMNALDLATKEALKNAVDRAGGDESARAVVITGTGRAFCVGQDLREHIANMSSKSMQEVWATVPEHFAPIAAVNGVAAGAGASLAFLCDFRIVADSAGFNTAFTGIGLSCDTGASWTLPRLVGTDKALELLMMPRTVSAQEALELGMATRVVPAGELDQEVSALASALAQGPTLAYGAVRRSVAFGATSSLVETLAFEGDMMARTGSSEDHANAVKAFVEKRQPTFEGH